MGHRNNRLFALKATLKCGGKPTKRAKQNAKNAWTGTPWNERAKLRRKLKAELEQHGMRSKAL